MFCVLSASVPFSLPSVPIDSMPTYVPHTYSTTRLGCTSFSLSITHLPHFGKYAHSRSYASLPGAAAQTTQVQYTPISPFEPSSGCHNNQAEPDAACQRTMGPHAPRARPLASRHFLPSWHLCVVPLGAVVARSVVTWHGFGVRVLQERKGEESEECREDAIMRGVRWNRRGWT
jgi:hypothetical protein